MGSNSKELQGKLFKEECSILEKAARTASVRARSKAQKKMIANNSHAKCEYHKGARCNIESIAKEKYTAIE